MPHPARRSGLALASAALALAVLVPPRLALAEQGVVAPFLQLATTDSLVVVWETDTGEESRVRYGVGADLSTEVLGSSAVSADGTRLHRVTLPGLSPGALLSYQAFTGSYSSTVAPLRVPSGPDTGVRLVGISDMQQDSSYPYVFADLVSDGIIPFLETETGLPIERALHAVLIAGDLVQDGFDYDSWADTYFAPAAPLYSRVPSYPVPGNHERDTGFYYDYFVLPDNGTAGYEEHWWTHDVGNVRVVGLDSNAGYTIDAQLTWLDALLAATCADPDVDFLVAELHHPFKSELWIPGENLWTGRVVERLDSFSSGCGIPTVHLFGHTHGYSRGQSRDHQHLWVNVATAGGRIDSWGEYPQRDYPEFVTSQDSYGFVVLETEAGDAPTLRVRRVSRGRPEAPVDNVVTDDIAIRADNEAPTTPAALEPLAAETPAPDAVRLRASAFVDPDGDGHGASHWQVSTACDDWSAPVIDQWIQDRNEYFRVDLNAGIDLEQVTLPPLESETDYCWRVRTRDAGLLWSGWSTPTPFRTGRATYTGNLIDNPGAEEGTVDWTVQEGVLESLEGGDCDGIAPHGGERYFAVGGLCESSARGVATQDVAFPLYVDRIDAGLATASLQAWLADYAGDDEPTVDLLFLDAEGAELGRSATLLRTEVGWSLQQSETLVPVGTRSARVVLTGTRNVGEDNDSYVDDLVLRLRFTDPPAGDDDGDDDDAVPEPTGCGCTAGSSTSGAAGAGWLVLGALVAGRRRRRSA